MSGSTETGAMQERELIEALKWTPAPEVGPETDCPGEAEFAAWLDGALQDDRLRKIETHVAGCGYCEVQAAAVLRSFEDTSIDRVPDEVLARAEKLAQPRFVEKASTQRHQLPLRLRWAAAAVLVLSVGIVATQWRAPTAAPAEEVPRQTRYVAPNALQPKLQGMSEGSVIEPTQQVFQWTEVPGTLFYEVRLVSPDGDLLLRERVDGTRWQIPGNLHLQRGEEYFVRVDAYLSDAKYVSSEHLAFRVGGRD